MTKEQDQEKVVSKSGFSLAEILVAILILASVTLGIIALLPSGYTEITNAGRLSVMNHLGQKKLDELRILPYTHTDLAVGVHPASPAAEWPLGTGAHYGVKWTVVSPGPTGTTKSKYVTVTVGYDTYNTDGTAKSSSASTNDQTYDFKTVITE